VAGVRLELTVAEAALHALALSGTHSEMGPHSHVEKSSGVRGESASPRVGRSTCAATGGQHPVEHGPANALARPAQGRSTLPTRPTDMDATKPSA
jgi:hypothetical protein